MKVDIYSDVVCPWCYLGKRRFEAALADFAGRDEVEIEWRPFQLDPSAPPVPRPKPEQLAAKFGGEEHARAAISHVTKIAAEDGLALNLEAAQTVNTFTAHRLLWWAGNKGGRDVQADLTERLFAAHLTDAADLSDHTTLAGLASEVGLDGAADFLASDDGVAEVKEAIGEARALGIDSVPTYVFDGRWAVSGAQPAEIFRDLLDQVANATIGATEGGCCGGGCCG